MARELIRIEDVHRAFGPVKVLDSVNLRIDEGDRIGIVGHNGAGKTTFMSIALGLRKPTQGLSLIHI